MTTLKKYFSGSVSGMLLVGYLSISLACILASVINSTFLPLVIPAVIAGALVIPSNLRSLYLLFYAIIPFSMDIYLPGGLGTDLPTEPIMWILFGLGILYLLRYGVNMNWAFVVSPGSLLILLAFGWMLVATVFAEYPIYSVKFSLAKSWYLVACFYLAIYFLRDRSVYRRAMHLMAISCTIVVVYVLLNHATTGFSFAEAQFVVQPFFSNNVYYASMLITFLPILWILRQTTTTSRRWYDVAIFIILLGVLLSYKRIALVTLVFGVAWYFVMKLKLVKPALIAGFIALFGAAGYMVRNNEFLKHAPQYDQTISHYEFGDLLNATYKGQDVSTMERVYRWVAGYYMFRDRPLTGFGPTNFYPVYKSYAITPFKTYVSDNPEKSGMHNYLLMLTVEQGVPGLIIFLVLISYLLILGQRLYHENPNTNDRIYIMGWSICILVVFLISLMNEVLESDKIGPLFFLAAAMLIYQGLLQKNTSIREG